jgi:hypothetical protein
MIPPPQESLYRTPLRKQTAMGANAKRKKQKEKKPTVNESQSVDRV